MEDPEAEKLDNVVAIPSQVSTSPAKEAPPGDAETLPPIREGLAEVLPVNAKRKDGKNDVFYNPAQVFNRDLSVLVLSVFGKLREEEAQEKDRRRIERALAKAAAEKPPPPAEAPVETAEIQEQGEEATPKDEQVPRTALPQILEQMTGLKVLEALAATGIRTVRYAKELPVGPGGVKRIVANDLDENAVAHMKRNFAHNDLSGERVQAINSCANAHMYSRRAKGHGGLGQMAYDVIDLDPYGSVSPFVDAAVQAVSDGGLLCITSTDMPVLGGNHPETCFARYGGSALKAGYVHEMALRLVLHSFASAAARCGREVIPLLCASIDFYVRLFVRVYDSPQRAKRHASKTAIVHQCVQCDSFFTQKFGEMEEGKEKLRVAKVTCPGSECPECGGRLKVGGPFHSGPLYDTDFVQRCLQVCAPENMSTLPGVTSWKKITGLLTAMSEENDDALFYKLPNLCKSLKVNQVPLRQFRGTLTSLGYRVSHFHREPQAIKTNAPNQVVFDLLRLWAEEHPPTKCPLPALLEKEISLPRPLEWRTEGHQGEKVAKFLPNPEPNWGPKPRARSGAERPAEEPQPKRQTLETSAPEGAEPTEPAAKDSAMEAVEEK